jgi:aspartyl-tRNA(Asn)/glutamyl-tRNA(Gln) amidotransferase subunit B
MRYEAVIGLEVHAQLLTRTKAFCGCSTAFGASPNTHVCPVCIGLPGALPVLNAEAVRLAVRTALALSCRIRPHSRFARKNYFYPDLPKGYQISQYDEPLSDRGHLDIAVVAPPIKGGDLVAPPLGGGDVVAPPLGGGDSEGSTKRVGITRVHMEEDAGKTLHGAAASIVDLNRSGVPLVEIVGDPDLRSAAEAGEYLRTLRDILVFIGVNDGNLEEGSFRCDANVSLRPVGETRLGTRVELKNINSFRFVEKAIAHEIARQAAVLDAGGKVVQETRGWKEDDGTTFSLRNKEEAQDYRYFPDPDLPPLVIEQALIDQSWATMPELPRAKRARFVTEMGISQQIARVLTSHPRIAAFFEEAATLHGNATKVANFVSSEVLRDVRTHGLQATIPVSPRQVAQLLKLVDTAAISGKQAKDVYAKISGTGRAPEDVVAELGLEQVTDVGAIEVLCRRLIEQNPKQAAQLRAGKTALMGYFVGQVMKETGGSANPQIVNEVMRRLLEIG